MSMKMRCSGCFLECGKTDSLRCNFCSNYYHCPQCITWKIIENPKVDQNTWICRFCKKCRILKTLFMENYSAQDIRVLLDVKLKRSWSTYKFYRKASDCRKAISCSKMCYENIFKYMKDSK